MKPLNLTISAFGSYADVQTIDFTALGTNGLYLIAGETGAGKTTIFDAIAFALFGKASGESRNDYSMLRSDFAPEKTKTYVELLFISGGKKYTIRRSIKKTGQDVALTLPDETIVSKRKDADAKIAEVVGLDQKQFAQIVMIAQNDFLKFLQSNTTDRLAILRRIFGTESLKQFQERLKILVKQEEEKRKLILHDFARHEVDVYKREEQFAQWNEQVKADKTDRTELEKQIEIHVKQRLFLAAALKEAEMFMKDFVDLAQFRRDFEEHKTQSEEIAKTKRRITRGETALRKVKPLEDESAKAADNYAAAKSQLNTAKEQETIALTKREQAAKAVEILPPLAEAQNAYAASEKEHETAAAKLKTLTALKTNCNEIVRKQDTFIKTQDELAAVVDKLEKLPSVAECQADWERLSASLTSEEDKLKKLSALQKDVVEIIDRQNKLAKEQAEYKTFNSDFNAADEKYRSLEESFLRSQAGIIASGLTKGEPCPVCGSTSHPSPAQLTEDDVTEEQIKTAKEVKEKAQSKREEKSSKCGSLSAEVETLTKRFVDDVSGFIPDVTVKAAATQLTEFIGTAQSAVKDLSISKNAAEKMLSELKTKFESGTKKREELTPKVAALQGEIDTLVKRFISDFAEFVPDAQWETAKTELTDLLLQTQDAVNELTARKDRDKKTLDELTKNWDAATKRKTDAESAVKSAQTLVTERSANEQKLLKLRDAALENYKVMLQKHGFIDEAEYQAALVTENELTGMNKHVSDYEKRGEQLARDIARLEKETAGKELPDVEKLRKEAEAINAASKILNEHRDTINSRLSKIENALKELTRAASDFEKVEKSLAVVEQLSKTANGKIDFETYAQMAYFERVLRAANFRLNLMSQNRYSLLRKTEVGGGHGRSGLDIEVLDAYTGKARSANSLSGGESFTASLSLALGLSDIVQQSAGGVHLDAMFIDEGFGSLDSETLDIAIRTLSEMAGTDRIIGIISHVSELRERIDKQIRIEKSPSGSKVTVLGKIHAVRGIVEKRDNKSADGGA